MLRGKIPSLAVMAILLVLGFAGCLEEATSNTEGASGPSDGGPTAGFVPGETGTSGADPSDPASPTTRADSRVKVDPNATFIGAAHTHDWWGSDTQYIIMDDDFPTGPGGICAGAVTFPCNGGVQFIKFQSSGSEHERPNNVWPGTGKMEIRVKVGQVLSSFMLEVAGPGGFSWAKNRYEIKNSDTTITLDNLNESNTDPPHFRSSGWSFRIWVGPNSASAFTGPLHVTVTIFKGRDPPVDPPHPDYWGTDTQRVLVDGARVWTNYTRAFAGTGGGYGASPKLPPNATVTIGAGKIQVTMTWTNTDPAAALSKPGLTYCAPTGYCGNTYATWHKPRPTSETGNSRTYEFEVRPDEWDSPYVSRTAWGFKWYFDDPQGQEMGSFKGYVDWRIEIFKMG